MYPTMYGGYYGMSPYQMPVAYGNLARTRVDLQAHENAKNWAIGGALGGTALGTLGTIAVAAACTTMPPLTLALLAIGGTGLLAGGLAYGGSEFGDWKGRVNDAMSNGVMDGDEIAQHNGGYGPVYGGFNGFYG